MTPAIETSISPKPQTRAEDALAGAAELILAKTTGQRPTNADVFEFMARALGVQAAACGAPGLLDAVEGSVPFMAEGLAL